MAEKMTFEQNLLRIEQIVKLLEKGEVPLEQSLALFEEGTGLIKKCGAVLDRAEKKIMLLTAKEEGPQLEKFDAEEE